MEFGSKNEIVLEIDTNRNTVGNILWISPDSDKLIGYNPESLIGKSLDLLIPESVANDHNQRISQFMNTSRSNMVFRKNETVLINSKGQGIRCNIWVKPSFDTRDNRIVLNAYIEQTNWGNNFMLIDSMGCIEVIGKNFFPIFDNKNINLFKESVSIFKYSTTMFAYLSNHSKKIQKRFDFSDADKSQINKNGEKNVYKEEWMIGETCDKNLSQLLEEFMGDNKLKYEKYKEGLIKFHNSEKKNYYVEYSVQEFNRIDDNVVNYILTFNIVGRIVEVNKKSNVDFKTADRLGLIPNQFGNPSKNPDNIDVFFKYKDQKDILENRDEDELSEKMNLLADNDRINLQIVRSSIIEDRSCSNIKSRRMTVVKIQNQAKTSIARNSTLNKNPELITNIQEIDPINNINSSWETTRKSNSSAYKRNMKFSTILLIIVLCILLASILIYSLLTSLLTNNDLKKHTTVIIQIYSYLSKLLNFYTFAESVRLYPKNYFDNGIVQKSFERIVGTSYLAFKKLDKSLHDSLVDITNLDNITFLNHYGKFKSAIKTAELFYYMPYDKNKIDLKLEHFNEMFIQLDIRNLISEQMQVTGVYFGPKYWSIITKLVASVILICLIILLIRLIVNYRNIKQLNNLYQALSEIKNEDLNLMLLDKLQKAIRESKTYCQEYFTGKLKKTYLAVKSHPKSSEASISLKKTFTHPFTLSKSLKWLFVLFLGISSFTIFNLTVLVLSPSLISDINRYYDRLFKAPLLLNVIHYELVSLLKTVSLANSNTGVDQTKILEYHSKMFEQTFDNLLTTEAKLKDVVIPGRRYLINKLREYSKLNLCEDEQSMRYEVFKTYCQPNESISQGGIIVYPGTLMNKIKQQQDLIYRLVTSDSNVKRIVYNPKSLEFIPTCNLIFNQLSDINDYINVMDNFNYAFYLNYAKIGIEDFISWTDKVNAIQIIVIIAVCCFIIWTDRNLQREFYDSFQAAFWFIDIIPQTFKEKMKMMSVRAYF